MQNTFKKSLVIFLSFSLFSCANLASKKDDPSQKIVATYNGGKVTLNEAQMQLDKLTINDDKLRGLDFASLKSDQKELIIKEIILQKAAKKEALKRDLDDDKDYEEAVESYTLKLLQKKLYIDLVTKATSEENLAEKYQEFAKKMFGKKEVEVSFMVVKSEKLAKNFAKRLKKSPKSFSYLAKKYSLDKASAKKGGKLGYVVPNQLPKPLDQIISQLGKNEISKPMQLAKNKWLLVQTGKDRDYKIPKLEEVKANLKKALSAKAIKDFNDAQIEEAKIKLVI